MGTPFEEFLEERKTPNQSVLESPVGFWDRVLLGFGKTPQERSNIARKQGIKGADVDPIGLDFGDIADVASDVPTMVLGAIGAAGGGGLLAALGGLVGENWKQATASRLGSQGEPDFLNMGTQAAIEGTGAKVFGSLANKLANPRTAAASTSNITKNVLEPAEEFGVRSLPADALTESNFVGRAAARARAAATPHGDELKRAQQATRQELSDTFERIPQSLGVTSRTPRPSEDFAIKAADVTRTARQDAVGQMFNEARELVRKIADPKTIPIVKDESRQALGRMAQRSKVSQLPAKTASVSGARKELAKLSKDLDGIQNYEQLDAFRQVIGDKLRNPRIMEEFAKADLDRDLRDLYGGIARDLTTSLQQGSLARQFGQQGGELLQKPAVDALGVPIRESGADVAQKGLLELERVEHLASTPTVKRATSRGMQPPDELVQGYTGKVRRLEDGVPWPGKTVSREAQFALQNNPAAGQAIEGESIAGNLVEDITHKVSRAQEAQKAASEAWQSIYDLERPSVLRRMRDPGQAENLYRWLFSPRASVDNIKAFKDHIGAEANKHFGVSPEGKEAWKQIQGQLVSEIRSRSEDLTANMLPNDTPPLVGRKMLETLEDLGGQDVLTEALGKQAADNLYKFAKFIMNADPTQRTFSPVSAEAARKTQMTFFELNLLRRFVEEGMVAILRRDAFPAATSISSKWLTKGLAPEKQGLMRALGTGLSTGPMMGTSEYLFGRPQQSHSTYATYR